MENSHEIVNGNGSAENGHTIRNNTPPYQPTIKLSLPCLDIRVFYVRVSKCEIDDSVPHHLTINHIPLNHETLLEVNGSRIGIYSDGVLTHLRRNRLDKKSEEVTFVSTDSIRMSGSVKFEVFDKDILLLSGVLDLCHSNGSITGEYENHSGPKWIMNCESNSPAGVGFLKGKQYVDHESDSPEIEVYVAGAFSGNPIILTKTLQLSSKKKQLRKGMLESIPEYEASEVQKDTSYGLGFEAVDYQIYKPDYEDYHNYNYNRNSGMDYFEGEDGELSWFNAGVRVGVGIGLSICLGVGIGVGLLVRTYQGTTRNFRRRLP